MRGITELVASPAKAYQEVTAVDLTGGFAPRSLFQPMKRGRGCLGAGVSAVHCAFQQRSRPEMLFCVPWDELSETSLSQLGGSATARAHADIPRTSVQDLVCTAMEQTVVVWALDDIARAGAGCARPSLRVLESVTSFGMGRFVLRIVLNEGDPFRVFDVAFSLPSYRTRRVESVHILQVTRYRKYEACTPPGALPEFCVCDLP